MRSIRILSVLAAAAASFLAAMSLPARQAASNDGMHNATEESSVEQQLKNIDKQWLHAATMHDTDFLKQLFADGMFEVQRGGIIVTGEEMRKAIGTPGRQIQIDIDQIEVRGIYGDTAILTDRTTQEGVAPDGRKVSGLYTVMRVLMKQNGEWRAIGAGMTPLKPSSSAPPVFIANSKDQAKDQMGSVEKELIDLDHKWVDAATNGDTVFLKGLFGERMFEVQPDGHVAPAAEILKGIALRKPGQIEGYCDQIQIRGIYGNTAILTDRRVRKGKTTDGQDVSGQWRVARVLVKQDGKWRAVAAAMTPIDQP